MPMPTTRRGRYLYYRSRHLSKLTQCHNGRPRGGLGGKHRLSRGHDQRPFGKQASRIRYPLGPWFPGIWAAYPDDDPHKGIYRRPGIIEDFGHPDVSEGPNTHQRSANFSYYERRVKRMPPLHIVPLRPVIALPSGDWYQHYYPWFRYPSGQLNPNWWKGVDDDGNPPPDRP